MIVASAYNNNPRSHNPSPVANAPAYIGQHAFTTKKRSCDVKPLSSSNPTSAKGRGKPPLLTPRCRRLQEDRRTLDAQPRIRVDNLRQQEHLGVPCAVHAQHLEVAELSHAPQV